MFFNNIDFENAINFLRIFFSKLFLHSCCLIDLKLLNLYTCGLIFTTLSTLR